MAPKHAVAIVGGAISGSVAAQVFAERDIAVIVIEQNDRPYGKIEDGLPRWHSKQRRMEYGNIDARLAHPNVHFVPRTRLGRDVGFEELAKDWGLSALVLANGAWRDRPLGLEGADDFIDRGLVYQNPFIYWFNHKNERAYAGPRYEVPDGAICVGGGLASIDVIKVIQIELYQRALAARGVDVDMYTLEHDGIPKVCAARGIDPASLGVNNGRLVYRRRAEDMPLADAPPGKDSPEMRKKIEGARRKILEKCRTKFLFELEVRRMCQRAIIEGDRMVGVEVIETEVDGRNVRALPGTERELRSAMVISSIGSIPEPLPGIAMKGEYYTFSDWDKGEYAGMPGVWALGNVVTGKGNIRDSEIHAEHVATHLVESYLGVGESRELSIAEDSSAAIDLAERVTSRPPLPPGQIEAILERVRARQRAIGYESYRAWIDANTPPDLE
jgi:ferredoxin--NADP+ reductase